MVNPNISTGISELGEGQLCESTSGLKPHPQKGGSWGLCACFACLDVKLCHNTLMQVCSRVSDVF